jgi:hypothetical protein
MRRFVSLPIFVSGKTAAAFDSSRKDKFCAPAKAAFQGVACMMISTKNLVI